LDNCRAVSRAYTTRLSPARLQPPGGRGRSGHAGTLAGLPSGQRGAGARARRCAEEDSETAAWNLTVSPLLLAVLRTFPATCRSPVWVRFVARAYHVIKECGAAPQLRLRIRS